VIAGNDEQVARSAGLRKNKVRGSWVLMSNSTSHWSSY
jgi:hypothetical protein